MSLLFSLYQIIDTFTSTECHVSQTNHKHTLNSLGDENSLNTCLHIPHGKATSSIFSTTCFLPSKPQQIAIAINFLSPSETPLNTAVLSPQLHAP